MYYSILSWESCTPSICLHTLSSSFSKESLKSGMRFLSYCNYSQKLSSLVPRGCLSVRSTRFSESHHQWLIFPDVRHFFTKPAFFHALQGFGIISLQTAFHQNTIFLYLCPELTGSCSHCIEKIFRVD